MQAWIYKAWVKFFGKTKFRRLNSFLFNLSIRGLGVLNYKGYEISGEKWFLKTFLKSLIIKKHPIIFDVGASAGNYTKLIYEIFPNAKIYAFEPHPITFCKLSEELREIPSKLVNCGLGEQVSIKRLYDYVDKQGSAHATLHKEVISYLHKGQEVSLDVKIDTLNSFCKAKSISYIDFLKIDTEGNEYSCLVGGRQLLQNKKIGIIQFEFNEMNIISKVFMKDFFDLLEGYDFFRLLPNSLLPLKRHNSLQNNLFHFQNIIAVPHQEEPTN